MWQPWALSRADSLPSAQPPHEVREPLRVTVQCQCCMEPFLLCHSWSSPIKPISGGDNKNTTQTKTHCSGEGRENRSANSYEFFDPALLGDADLPGSSPMCANKEIPCEPYWKEHKCLLKAGI